MDSDVTDFDLDWDVLTAPRAVARVGHLSDPLTASFTDLDLPSTFTGHGARPGAADLESWFDA